MERVSNSNFGSAANLILQLAARSLDLFGRTLQDDCLAQTPLLVGRQIPPHFSWVQKLDRPIG